MWKKLDPSRRFMPFRVLGTMSLIVLPIATFARYTRYLQVELEN